MNIQVRWLLFVLVWMGHSTLAGQGKDRREETSSVRIQNTGLINSSTFDFSPAFYANGLVFVSSRLKGGMVDPNTGGTFFDLFYAPFDKEGIPQKAKLFSLEINSTLNEGPVCFDRAENTLFFTRNNLEQGVSKTDKAGKVVLKIYQAVRGTYDWEKVTELPFNRDSFSCMHPSLSPDDHRLFFASNMPGGYGGMDIYFVDREGDSWSEPINLGPEVNTTQDEAFPFIHESGVLFFSSNGHRSSGNFDVYSIDIRPTRWGQLRKLEPPINSPSDDVGIIISKDGKKGYFSSNRKDGKGKDDIYFFETPDGLNGLLEPRIYTLRLNVTDARINYPVLNASVYVFERSPDGRILNDSAYHVEVSSQNQDFGLRMIRKSPKELGTPKALTGRMGEAVVQLHPYRDYLILVSKDGYKLSETTFSPGSYDPSVPLPIALERNNCNTLRGVVRSAASGSPIPNAKVRVLNSCTQQEQHILSNANGVYEYCVELGCNYVLVGTKEGYDPFQAQLALGNVKESRVFELDLTLPQASKLASRTPLTEGAVIVLNNIYYDFNKSEIRSGQSRDLEALARLMTVYPTMEIELGAHTDSRGASDYNLTLSQERAESAKAFLLGRGIAAERIKAVGYGETRLRNGCTDSVYCSESEHQFNRRTEVKVLKIEEPIPVSPVKN